MMRANLYRLKRQYGGRITIHKKGETQVDARTGEKTVATTLIPIRRAIILPAENSREERRGISLISANKGLVQGGWYDTSLRYFIVEQHDAPDLFLTVDDWIVFDSKKYQVVEFRDFEFDACWVITARALLGPIPPQNIGVVANNDATVAQQAGNTP